MMQLFLLAGFLSGLCDRERDAAKAGGVKVFLSGLCDREH